MTREEALKKLEPFIPSLKREYIRWGKTVDKNIDKSWLYRDESYRKSHATWNDPDREKYLPEVISEHFLEGLTIEVEGESYVAERSREYDYRRVYLEVTDFACYGNTHKYGKLEIDGLHWRKVGEKSGWHSWGRLSDEEPRVTGIWDIDLFRIVGEGEMAGSECPPFEATARFVYLDELVATAAYVTLKRIEGPFILDNASSYATVREAKDILVTVGADGNVEWGEKIKRILNLI